MTPPCAASVLDFCLAAASGREGPLVLGLSGPQGVGKSTLAAHLTGALAARGRRAVAVSIDDFYLTHAQQRALHAATRNRYLEHRGYPGTHDVALGDRVLGALIASAGQEVRIPAYDKSAHGGRGDRAPEPAWRRVRGPFDVILVEGWMLGFTPADPAEIVDPALLLPNRHLARYAAWHRRLHAFVHLVASSLGSIVAWRVAAERARRAGGAPGLSDDDAREYVERFLPAYELYVPRLCRRCPVAGPLLRVVLDPDRAPLRDAPGPT